MRTVLNLKNKIDEHEDIDVERRKEIDNLNTQLEEIRVESNIFTKRSQNVRENYVIFKIIYSKKYTCKLFWKKIFISESVKTHFIIFLNFSLIFYKNFRI